MFKQLLPALRITLFFTIVTGFVYPAIVTVLSQAIFPDQANGSLISKNGQVVGSSLIAQNFAKPEYFHARPSAAGMGYDGAISGGSNLGPTSQKLVDRMKASAEQFKTENPAFSDPIPADALTASGSGLDPHISPATANAQVNRVATARGVDPAQIQTILDQFTESRTLGLLGEPRVNVLALNLALDKQVAGK